MIYEVSEDTKYYLAAAYTRKEYNDILRWKCYYSTDLILKGKTYYWLFGKEFNFTISEFKEKVYFHNSYTYENFRADVEALGNPKFIVIYVERPHSSGRIKTKEERDNDTLMTVMAACNSGAY